MLRAALLGLLLTGLAGPGGAQDSPPAPRPAAPASESPRPEARPERTEPDTLPLEKPQPAPQPKAPAPPAPVPVPEPIPEPQGPPAPPLRETLRESDFVHSVCLLDLSLLGAVYDEPAPVTDPVQRDCGIARPILLHAPLPGIEIPGGALMRCETAWHLAHWLRDFVRPAAATLGQPPLTALEPGSAYQCRATVGDKDRDLSEHAFGNALDIAAFRFADGSRIEIRPRDRDGDRGAAFQAAVRGAACLHFTTVLGPGSNAAHGDHLHLDIKARSGGWRLCQ